MLLFAPGLICSLATLYNIKSQLIQSGSSCIKFNNYQESNCSSSDYLYHLLQEPGNMLMEILNYQCKNYCAQKTQLPLLSQYCGVREWVGLCFCCQNYQLKGSLIKNSLELSTYRKNVKLQLMTVVYSRKWFINNKLVQ